MAASVKQPPTGAGNLGVETPGPQLQLTPNFMNSIFNDGMNPFDEYFGCSTPNGTSSFLASTLRKEYGLDGENPRVLKDQMLPTINTKLEQTLTPEQSPKSLAMGESAVVQLAISRSPSPFTFTGKLPDSPASSVTPITSPEEVTAESLAAAKSKSANSSANLEKSNGASRKSFSAIKNTKATLHKRNMSLPQSWNPTFDASIQASGVRQLQPSTFLPRGLERQGVDGAISRMDGIFVNENIPNVEIKLEPDSPVRPSFENKNSSASSVGRKRKKSMADEDDEDDDDEDTKHLNETEKRARFLERNRVAASKCRKKKKLMNQRLEEKSRLLVQQNRFLSATLTKLRGDVLRLKQLLLTHHDCKHAPIERYLHQEAGRYLAAEGADDIAKRVEVGSAESRFAGMNALLKPEDKMSSAGWLNGFHSFQEVETEALKRTNPILEFDDEAFQKLLLGDQLTLLDDDFGTSPPSAI